MPRIIPFNYMEILSTKDVSFTFGKSEKLCKTKSIDRLFLKGDSFIAYPLRVVYFLEEREEEKNDLSVSSVLVSVSKKKFKRAVKRNRVKRLIREAYRLNKTQFLDSVELENKQIEIAFLYLKSELPTYEEIEKAMMKALTTLDGKLKEDNEE